MAIYCISDLSLVHEIVVSTFSVVIEGILFNKNPVWHIMYVSKIMDSNCSLYSISQIRYIMSSEHTKSLCKETVLVNAVIFIGDMDKGWTNQINNRLSLLWASIIRWAHPMSPQPSISPGCSLSCFSWLLALYGSKSNHYLDGNSPNTFFQV